jgi:ribosomal protein S12 methylthiotransferase
VRTTALVGFPGETAAAVDRLIEFLEDVRFDRLGVFTYSPEEGTPAPSLPDQVPAEVAGERAALVQECQERITWDVNAKLVGQVLDVLVDGPSEDPAFAFEGRTAGQAPEIDGVVYLRDARRGVRAFTPGRFARARIVEVEGHELVGERA